ncbi:MAG: ABC transporter permease subunit [Rubrivivax sp.]|nr:ABC transporter permease subunit [Rubrivivax sp.]
MRTGLWLWHGLLLLALCFSGLVLLMPLLQVVQQGAGQLSAEFLLAAPRDAGRAGGIAPMLVSTLWIVALALALALPPALAGAVALNEMLDPESALAATLRTSLDVLAGVPSIVFGLFGLAFFCRQLGMGYSIAAGGATLACMILPTLTRALTSALQAVPGGPRLAGASLGLSKATVLWRVTVPLALPGMCAALMLALTRGLAETALLLFTSGYADRMPGSVWDSGRTVSVHIYDLATNVPGGTPRAYGSALVLLLVLLLLSLLVHGFVGALHRRAAGGTWFGFRRTR